MFKNRTERNGRALVALNGNRHVEILTVFMLAQAFKCQISYSVVVVSNRVVFYNRTQGQEKKKYVVGVIIH